MGNQFAGNLYSLEGRVIVLTGGAGYLGRQYTEAFWQAGALVVVFDLERPPFQERYAAFHAVDITDYDAVMSTMTEVHKRFGKIDSLVNNAALNPAVGDPSSAKMLGPYELYPPNLWRKEIEVNVTGMHFCTQAVAPFMMEARRGSIVNIASEVSERGYDWTDVYEPGKYKSIAYIASKHAVIGITHGWAAYLGKYGVRVNAFSPGGVQNERVPLEFAERYGRKNMLGTMAQPGDHVGPLIFLLSDASLRTTGANFPADGGKTAW